MQNNIFSSYLEDSFSELQTQLFEASKSRGTGTGKEKQITKAFEQGFYELNGKKIDLNFGDLKDKFHKAAVILMQRTRRGAATPSGKPIALAGNVPMTVDDVMFLIGEAKKDEEWMNKFRNSTHTAIANELRDTLFTVIATANWLVSSSRKNKGYKGKLAYELDKNQMKQLVGSIKYALDAIKAKTGKLKKVKNTAQHAHTAVLNDVIDYIITKQGPMRKEIQSDKKLDEAIKIVMKYAGTNRLIYPSLSGEIKAGDKYKSLFSYLNKLSLGRERVTADKFIKKYRNKANAQIRKALFTDVQLKRELKRKVREAEIHKTPGGMQHITTLIKLSQDLLREFPEYKSLMKSQGIHSPIDELVGMIGQLIRVGALEVQG